MRPLTAATHSPSEEEVGETSYVDEPTSGSGMGTFADLLKAAQSKKKK